MTRVFFHLLLSRNFDNRLSSNFHRFVILCICWDTPTVKTSLWELPIVSSVFNSFVGCIVLATQCATFSLWLWYYRPRYVIPHAIHHVRQNGRPLHLHAFLSDSLAIWQLKLSLILRHATYLNLHNKAFVLPIGEISRAECSRVYNVGAERPRKTAANLNDIRVERLSL